MSTIQAVQDLEAFRVQFGLGKIWIYGGSYGTQFVQTYAALFPESVEMMVIDSNIDTSLDIWNYSASLNFALNDIMYPLLAACYDDDICRADLCNDKTFEECQSSFSNMDFSLKDTHKTVKFPLADGTVKRDFGDSFLESVVLGLLYTPSDRAYALRALAYAQQRDDWIQLLRWTYVSSSINETSLQPIPAGIYDSWSDASYYVICAADYEMDLLHEGGTDGTVWADDFVNFGNGLIALPFGSYWFVDPPVFAFFQAGRYSPARMPYLSGVTDFPVLIVTTDVDCATPFVQSVNVHAFFLLFSSTQLHARYSNSYMLVVEGGPHVAWLYWYPCVDPLINNFLLGTMPNETITYCSIDVPSNISVIS